MVVREIQLAGKRFTWSNGQSNPTMSRIDRAFCITPWEELHLDPILRPESASSSDHCLLILQTQEHMPKHPTFIFEVHWLLMLGLTECVQQAWNKRIIMPQNAMLILHIKLSRIARLCPSGCNIIFPKASLQQLYVEVINQLDIAQEFRALTPDEIHLKKLLKSSILGLAAIERSRARQKSQLTWLKKGDANTKFFHISANIRRNKNHIVSLRNGNEIVTSQDEKHKLTYEHF
jgi:hypothetical protein